LLPGMVMEAKCRNLGLVFISGPMGNEAAFRSKNSQ
jgi:hypothetical protein